MTGVLIDNISIILQVKTFQLDTCKRIKIQLSKQKYNFSPVTPNPFLSPHLSRATGNIYLFLSLGLSPEWSIYLILSLSIFFSIFRDRPLVIFLFLYPSVSILTTKWRVQFWKVLCPFYIGEDYYFYSHKI